MNIKKIINYQISSNSPYFDINQIKENEIRETIYYDYNNNNICFYNINEKKLNHHYLI